MHQRVHETLLDRGPLLFVSNDEQQVRWMKEESPWIYPGECQNVDGPLRKGIFLQEAIDWQRRDEERLEPFIDALAASHWFASFRSAIPSHNYANRRQSFMHL